MLKDIDWFLCTQHKGVVKGETVLHTHTPNSGVTQYVLKSKFEDGLVFETLVERLGPGIYLGGLNFDHTINMFAQNVQCKQRKMFGHSFVKKSPLLTPTYETPIDQIDFDICDYGVADNLEQVLEYGERFVESPRQFVLSLCEMRKQDQPPEGGWRWHKWGRYIGKQNPQHEYLYDEENIESVFVFHFLEVENRGP